ncbi:MAG: biofilm-associated protein, partial [Nitrosopumilaceae archaeon]
MHWSFRRIFLLLIIISLASVFSFTELEAQEKLITAKSIGFEETTIIEFKNSEGSKSNIDTIRMWLGSDYSFKSFKTEKGWIGEKTPQGVIVFTTTKPIKAGEVVKFGLKTDKP